MNIQEPLSPECIMEKMEAIEQLGDQNVDEKTILELVELLSTEDKGLKNSVTNFLISNPNPIIPELVLSYTTSDNIEMRNLAGEILLKKGSSCVDAVINKLIICENNDNIKFLIDVLGLIGDTKVENDIIEILTSSKDENVILACVETLGNLKSKKALDEILALFNLDDKYKAPVIDAAGKIGSVRALDFITENLDTEDELLQYVILESLGEIGTEKTYYELLSRIEAISGPAVWAILESIYKLKEKYDLDLPFDDKLKKNVLDTVINAETRYQKIAAHMVTVFDDPEILYACLIIYGNDAELDEILSDKFCSNTHLILIKIHNLIDIQPANLLALLTLTQLLTQQYKSVHGELNSFEKQKLTETISKCLSHVDENIRIAAVEALHVINPESILLFIDSLIEDDNVWNKLRLLDIISEINHPDVITALEKLSSDNDEMVREKANEIFDQKQYPLKKFTNK